jgi:uncharacterized protein YdeI (BOF family)
MKPGKLHAMAALLASASLAFPLLADTGAGPSVTIASLERGQQVIVAGSVDRITDEDEFILRDATGTVRVYVGPNRVPASQGETITVHGIVDDDLPLEVYATAITRADGTRVDLPHEY